MNQNQLEQYITTGDLAGLNVLLSENPALAKSTTSHRISPIMLSCYYKKPEVTAFLMKYIDKVNLFEAVAAGKFDDVAHLVNTYPDAVNYYAEDGFTPLGLACYFGQYEIARFLILKGAEVDMPSNNGYNVYPIHSAAAGNYTDIVALLIESGANINVKQEAGVTPIHSAAQNGNLDLLILLLENNADINIRMQGGKLPADLAREKGFMDIAEALSEE
jgi:ankyrin repeat protein